MNKIPLLTEGIFAWLAITLIVLGNEAAEAGWQASRMDWESVTWLLIALISIGLIVLAFWVGLMRLIFRHAKRQAMNTAVDFTYDQACEIADRQAHNEQAMMESLKIRGMAVNDSLKGRKG